MLSDFLDSSVLLDLAIMTLIILNLGNWHRSYTCKLTLGMGKDWYHPEWICISLQLLSDHEYLNVGRCYLKKLLCWSFFLGLQLTLWAFKCWLLGNVWSLLVRSLLVWACAVPAITPLPLMVTFFWNFGTGNYRFKFPKCIGSMSIWQRALVEVKGRLSNCTACKGGAIW